jgi:Tfp pilus assembly protein FimT
VDTDPGREKSDLLLKNHPDDYGVTLLEMVVTILVLVITCHLVFTAFPKSSGISPPHSLLGTYAGESG